MSGVSTLQSIVPVHVSSVMSASELENRHTGSAFTHSLGNVRFKWRQEVGAKEISGGVGVTGLGGQDRRRLGVSGHVLRGC